jgi:hypothetical protein
MSFRRPLILVNGEPRQIPTGETIPGCTIFAGDDTTLSASFTGRELYNAGGGAILNWEGAGILLPVAGLISINTGANTVAAGLRIYNTVATAASGSQRYSPAILWEAQGWKTDPIAASQTVIFRAYNKTIQGTANPSAQWVLESSLNGGAYGNALTYDLNGILSITGIVPYLGLTDTLSGTCGAFVASYSPSGWAMFAVNRNPRSGVFSNTGAGMAQILLTSDSSGGYIDFQPSNAANTVAVTAIRMCYSGGMNIGDTTDPGVGILSVKNSMRINNTQVIAARKTGWGLPTGTLNRVALTNASTQTQFNQALMALITDLHSTAGHGLVGT